MPCQDGGRQSMAILPAQILPAPGARNQQLQERNTVGAQGNQSSPQSPSLLTVCPRLFVPIGEECGNVSSLTLHSPSHLLEGQSVEQDTKCQPWPHSSYSQPLISPGPFGTSFNHPCGEEKVPGEQTPILC